MLHFAKFQTGFERLPREELLCLSSAGWKERKKNPLALWCFCYMLCIYRRITWIRRDLWRSSGTYMCLCTPGSIAKVDILLLNWTLNHTALQQTNQCNFLIEAVTCIYNISFHLGKIIHLPVNLHIIFQGYDADIPSSHRCSTNIVCSTTSSVLECNNFWGVVRLCKESYKALRWDVRWKNVANLFAIWVVLMYFSEVLYEKEGR